MTLQLLIVLSIWLGLGCLVAWLIGRASDIGGANDSTVIRKIGIAATDLESDVFTNQCHQVRVILSRE